MKVTYEKIKEYCWRMNYKLLKIGKIGFAYIKPNGEKCALLKAAAHSLDHRPPNNTVEHGQANCSVCGEKGIHQPWCSAGQGFVNTPVG